MNPTFRELFLNMDQAEHRVQFLTAESAEIAALEEHHNDRSCTPLFKFYYKRALVGTLVGADAPALERMVQQNVPDYEDD